MKKPFFKKLRAVTACVAAALLLCSGIAGAEPADMSTEPAGDHIAAQTAVPDEYEPNDVFGEATVLAAPFSIEATVFPEGDHDFYTFEVPADQYVSVLLNQPGDPVQTDLFYALKLYDADGQLIDFSDRKGNCLFSRHLAPGSYFVLVYAIPVHDPDDPDVPIQPSSAVPYGLSVSFSPMDTADFSEYHLINAAYNPSAPYSFDRGRQGGILNAANVYTSVACLSRREGIANETSAPYVLYYEDDEESPYVDRSKAFYETLTPSRVLTNAVMLPRRTGPLDNDHYKNAIYTYGALYCGIREDERYYSDEKSFYYHPEELIGGSGHAVTVVGWDDSVPKERFTVYDDEGTAHAPQGDGAFLIKNSYGPQRGMDGYLYVSYYSSDFSNNAATVIQTEDTPRTNVIYCHDAYGYTGFYANRHPYAAPEAWMKNAFTASSAQVLDAISFYTLSPRTAYDIFIETGGKRTMLASGAKEYAGYYTVPLSFPVTVETGQNFSVIVRLKGLDGTNREAAVEERTPGYAPNASARAGESFFSADGQTWQDISAEGANNCIKVYAYDANAQKLVLNATDEENSGKDDTTNRAAEAAGDVAGFEQNADTFSLSVPYLPAQFDLRNIGAVSSIRNQGNPPTCWTFATMGSAESVWLKAHSGFESPVSVTVSGASSAVALGADAYATAHTLPGDTIYWSFSGDLDSITIKNRTSASGENTLLFTATAPGKITARAASALDGTKFAEYSFEIGTPQPSASRQPEETQEEQKKVPQTDDPSLLSFYIASMFCAALPLRLALKRIKRSK